MTRRTFETVSAVVVVAVAIGALVVSRARGQNTVGWMNHDANWSSSKRALQEFGERFQTSDAMFDAFKQQAHGGTRLTWAQMGEPALDWSGTYTRTMASLQ